MPGCRVAVAGLSSCRVAVEHELSSCLSSCRALYRGIRGYLYWRSQLFLAFLSSLSHFLSFIAKGCGAKHGSAARHPARARARRPAPDRCTKHRSSRLYATVLALAAAPGGPAARARGGQTRRSQSPHDRAGVSHCPRSVRSSDSVTVSILFRPAGRPVRFRDPPLAAGRGGRGARVDLAVPGARVRTSIPAEPPAADPDTACSGVNTSLRQAGNALGSAVPRGSLLK